MKYSNKDLKNILEEKNYFVSFCGRISQQNVKSEDRALIYNRDLSFESILEEKGREKWKASCDLCLNIPHL